MINRIEEQGSSSGGKFRIIPNLWLSNWVNEDAGRGLAEFKMSSGHQSEMFGWQLGV